VPVVADRRRQHGAEPGPVRRAGETDPEATLTCDLDGALGDARPGDGRPEKVEVLVDAVALDAGVDVVLEEILAHVLDVNSGRADLSQ